LEHSEDSEKKDLADVVLAGLGGSMSSVWQVAALSNKKPASFSSGESMWATVQVVTTQRISRCAGPRRRGLHYDQTFDAAERNCIIAFLIAGKKL